MIKCERNPVAIFDSSCTEPSGFIMAVDGVPQGSKLFVEKQIVDDLLQKLPAFSGSRKFITVFQEL
jgi:hypothetical protein